MWNKTLKHINRTTENITITLLVVMVVITFVKICTRLLALDTFAWIDELARYLFIWTVFLGSGIAFKHGSHMSLELFFNRLSNSKKSLAQLAITIISSIFLLVLLFKGIELINLTMGQTTAVLGIPMGYVYISIPLSGILMILNLVDITIDNFKKQKREVS